MQKAILGQQAKNVGFALTAIHITQMSLNMHVTSSRGCMGTTKWTSMVKRLVRPLSSFCMLLLLAIVIELIGAIMLHLEELTQKC